MESSGMVSSGKDLGVSIELEADTGDGLSMLIGWLRTTALSTRR
jgi:hypothetical protein